MLCKGRNRLFSVAQIISLAALEQMKVEHMWIPPMLERNKTSISSKNKGKSWKVHFLCNNEHKKKESAKQCLWKENSHDSVKCSSWKMRCLCLFTLWNSRLQGRPTDRSDWLITLESRKERKRKLISEVIDTETHTKYIHIALPKAKRINGLIIPTPRAEK